MNILEQERKCKRKRFIGRDNEQSGSGCNIVVIITLTIFIKYETNSYEINNQTT